MYFPLEHNTRRSSSHAHRVRLAWLLALTGTVALPGIAQASTCTGVFQWDPAKIYRVGASLQKGSALYQVEQMIWNAPPDHPAGAQYYKRLSACEAGNINLPLRISLTSPSNVSSFSVGSAIDVTADALDPNGNIGKVEFFSDGRSLGVDTSAPYGTKWISPGAGTHTFRAVATDNNNVTAITSTITITVEDAGGDTIAPSVPVGLAVSPRSSDSIVLGRSHSTDNIGGNGVAGYDVYRNGSFVGTTSSASYVDGELTSSSSYSYSYRVRARDNAGNASAQGTTVTASTLAGDGGTTGKRVIGYFTQWGIHGRNYRVENIDSSGSAARLTHIKP